MLMIKLTLFKALLHCKVSLLMFPIVILLKLKPLRIDGSSQMVNQVVIVSIILTLESSYQLRMISFQQLLIVMKFHSMLLILDMKLLIITLLRVVLVQDILLILKPLKLMTLWVYGMFNNLSKKDLILSEVVLQELILVLMVLLCKNLNLIDLLLLDYKQVILFVSSILNQVNSCL